MSSPLKIRWCFFMLCFCISSSRADDCALATASVIFPFSFQSFSAITAVEVVAAPMEKWTVKSKADVSRLRQILTHGSTADFNDGNVRAAILIDGKAYFMDRTGVVVTEGKHGIQIDLEELIKFRDALPGNQRLDTTCVHVGDPVDWEHKGRSRICY